MILVFLMAVSGIQIAAYMILDRHDQSKWKVAVLLSLLIGNCLVFSQLFFPKLESGCGMPILGITLAFWIFGNAITLLVHLGYFLVRKKQKKERHHEV